jgi:hypothetical protein
MLDKCPNSAEIIFKNFNDLPRFTINGAEFSLSRHRKIFRINGHNGRFYQAVILKFRQQFYKTTTPKAG